MKNILTLLCSSLVSLIIFGQDLSGVWETGADNQSVNLYTKFTVERSENNVFKGTVYERRSSSSGTYQFEGTFTPETSKFVIKATVNVKSTERHRPSLYNLTYIRVGGYEYLKGTAVSLIQSGDDFVPVGIPTKLLFKRIAGADKIKVILGFDAVENIFDFDGDDKSLFEVDPNDQDLANTRRLFSDESINAELNNYLRDINPDLANVSYQFFEEESIAKNDSLSDSEPINKEDDFLADNNKSSNPVEETNKNNQFSDNKSNNPFEGDSGEKLPERRIYNVNEEESNKLGYDKKSGNPETYDSKSEYTVRPKLPYSNKKYEDYYPYETYEEKAIKYKPYEKSKIAGIYSMGNTKVVKVKLTNLKIVGSENPINIYHNGDEIASNLIVTEKGYEMEIILYSNKTNRLMIYENHSDNTPGYRMISIKTDAKTYYKNLYFDKSTNLVIELVK